jgi:hypothetical protein
LPRAILRTYGSRASCYGNTFFFALHGSNQNYCWFFSVSLADAYLFAFVAPSGREGYQAHALGVQRLGVRLHTHNRISCPQTLTLFQHLFLRV